MGEKARGRAAGALGGGAEGTFDPCRNLRGPLGLGGMSLFSSAGVWSVYLWGLLQESPGAGGGGITL